MRRAFTLIEILISASVLGLGVLGIATLFAGAARQQQIAAEQTDAERSARNIDALIGRRFERFAGGAFDETSSLSGPPLFALGQWYPVASIPYGGIASGRLRGALSLDMSDNGIVDQSAFGVRASQDFLLYSLNGALLTDTWASGVSAPATIWTTSQATRPVGAAPGGQYDLARLRSAVSDGASVFLERIPGGRFQPDLTVRLEIFREVYNGLTGQTVGLARSLSNDREFTFRDLTDVTSEQAPPDLWPEYEPGASSSRIVLVDANEASPTAGPSRLFMEVQAPDSSDPPYAFLGNGSTIHMRDSDPSGDRFLIGRIVLENAQVRDDRLLSFDERIAYTPDASFPGGQRPTSGVALLFKRGERTDQLLSISYTMEPLGRVDFDPSSNELPFVPPDTFERLYDASPDDPSQYGLFTQVELELAYDPALENYVVRADPDDEWAIQKGQIVVIASRNNPVLATSAPRPSDFDDAGAVSPLTILTTRRNNTVNKLEGVLSAPPYREGFDPMLEDLESEQVVWAWVMRDVVRSAAGAPLDIDWRIRPTGARVITFGADR